MKLIVEIDLGNNLVLSAEEYKDIARPLDKDNKPIDGFVTVDNAFLKLDHDDSFYVFKLIDIVKAYWLV